MRSIEDVRTLLMWATVWMAFFMAWFEVAPRVALMYWEHRER